MKARVVVGAATVVARQGAAVSVLTGADVVASVASARAAIRMAMVASPALVMLVQAAVRGVLKVKAVLTTAVRRLLRVVMRVLSSAVTSRVSATLTVVANVMIASSAGVSRVEAFVKTAVAAIAVGQLRRAAPRAAVLGPMCLQVAKRAESTAKLPPQS